MNKQNIAVIGIGGAGNKLLDVLLDIDARYNGIYCNTNITEMMNLKHYIAGQNALYFPNAQGTGRNPDKAEIAIKQEQSKTMDFLYTRFSPDTGIEYYYLLCSSDGGTGSGGAPLIAKAIKAVNPDAVINVLATMVSLDEKGLSLKNTVRFWNKIVKLMKNGIVNSVQFIDNNKMKNEEEFNQKVMEEFDNSLSLNNETIDISDSTIVNTEKGYKVTLTLDPSIENLGKAMKVAKEKSNFLLPEDLKCSVCMCSVDKESFDKNDVKEYIKNNIPVSNFDKYDYNEENINVLVLGGTQMPKDYINMIKEAIEENHCNDNINEIISDDLIIDIEENNNKATTSIKTKDKSQNHKSTMSRKRLRNLMNNTDLWD